MALPDHYLELIKRSLLNELHVELEAILHYFLLRRRDQAAIEPAVVRDIARLRPDIVADIRGARHKGTAVRWPGKPGEAAYEPRDLAEHVHTTIGRERLDQLHRCLDEIARDKIPGDVIEAGAWRGGTAIFMRAYLLAHELNDRIVWVA